MPTVQSASRARRRARGFPSTSVRARGYSLGLTTVDPAHLVKRVQAGFSFGRLVHFGRVASLSMERIAHYVRIAPRTLTRRQNEGRLRTDESERLLRVASLFEKAVELFEGDKAATLQWLQSPQHGLGGEVPLEYAATEIGARQVEDLIDRLEHGVFA